MTSLLTLLLFFVFFSLTPSSKPMSLLGKWERGDRDTGCCCLGPVTVTRFLPRENWPGPGPNLCPQRCRVKIFKFTLSQPGLACASHRE